MYNKKGFEFTFAWMFSMIVGAVILFLAIYGVVNLIGSERNVIDSFSAQQLGIILQPLETQSFESGIRPMNINFPSETKLGFRCNNEDVFEAFIGALIVDLTLTGNQTLATQMRNKTGLNIKNTNFQTSNIGGIVLDNSASTQNAEALKANLLNMASGATTYNDNDTYNSNSSTNNLISGSPAGAKVVGRWPQNRPNLVANGRKNHRPTGPNAGNGTGAPIWH